MTKRHGTHVWYELLTTDLDAATAFYSDVVGWKIDPQQPGNDVDYRMISAADGAVAGMGLLPETAAGGRSGMKPGWLGYVGVDDVDATAAAVTQHGGAIHVPPMDIPGIGRFALVADPQGASFYVMRGSSEQPSNAFAPGSAGHCSWNELATSDPVAAQHFYAALFGWLKDGAMAMGEMGDYTFLKHHDQQIGAVMGQTPGGPLAWTYYFNVDDVPAAAARIAPAGGSVTHGPAEVPGDRQIVMGIDPQGAMFALVGPKS